MKHCAGWGWKGGFAGCYLRTTSRADACFLDRYEMFDLRVIHRRRRTGFEDSKEFPIRKNDLIAGRYQVRTRQYVELLSCICNFQQSGLADTGW